MILPTVMVVTMASYVTGFLILFSHVGSTIPIIILLCNVADISYFNKISQQINFLFHLIRQFSDFLQRIGEFNMELFVTNFCFPNIETDLVGLFIKSNEIKEIKYFLFKS